MDGVPSFVGSARALWGDGKGRLLVAIAGGWGLLIGTRMIYPVLLPHLRLAFDLSLTDAGLLVTILWLGSALGQLPGGVLADRHSERAILTASPIVVSAALLLVVTADSPIVLYAATVLVGLGLSLYPIARITILTDIYPDNIGSAIGVTMATGDVGQTVLPPVAGVIAAWAAWQLGFLALVPVFLVVAVGIWVTLPAQLPTQSAVDAFSPGTARYVIAELRRPSMLFMTLILFLYIFIWQAFTGFYPTYLIDVKGLPTAVVGVLFGLFFAVGVIVKPVAGAAYDRIGVRWALVVVLLGPVAGFVLLPVAEGTWPLAAVTVLVSTMLGTGAITQSYLADTFPADMRGTGLGVIRTTSATLGSVGPVAFGVAADNGYFGEAYVALGGVMVAVILLTLRMPGR